jgi:thiamine-monophosphate kinase
MISRTATLGEVGEFTLIDAITTGLALGADVLLGPGDDAAVLAVDGPVVTSVDVLVEGVHFRRDWSEARDVGRKAVAVNVADLEAMGAQARGIVVGFSAPPELPVSWALDFVAGLRDECTTAGVSLLGGDVTKARDITISVTVLGGLAGRAPVRRSGAQPGDVVAVRGRLGWSAAGLAVLGRGFRSPRAVVEAHRVPQVAYGQGAVAADAGATAMIDVSDGLLADLGHIAAASGVTIDLELAALEIPEALRVVSVATGVDPHTWVLTGGEDHALAATVPTSAQVPADWQVIGTVRAPAGSSETGDSETGGSETGGSETGGSETGGSGADPAGRVTVDGSVWAAPAGYDHFRTRR